MHGQDIGKKLFRAKCLICHGIRKNLTGPALDGVRERVGNDSLLYSWIRNNKKVLSSGNPYFTKLYHEWNKAPMNIFEELSDQDITDILAYVEKKAAEERKLENGEMDKSSSSSILIIVLISVFVGAVLIGFRWLKKKQKTLEKLSNEEKLK